MEARKLVAHNLRRMRIQRGISQENLAIDASIDRTYMSRLERGLENPTVGVLEQIANALNAEIVGFFRIPQADDLPLVPLRSGRKRYLK